MAEKDMRLRLVLRRDGLPEDRLIWHVPLENDPTISKLLEKVNETIPLEIGQRGLEDYVVELRDDDGTSFECLHFQPVRTVLKSDDRVFIRALDRDDNRRRRISGRHQISSDGRRLIDGIPFGRRLLKAPSGRPPIDTPPPKRPRLAYNHEDTQGDWHDKHDTPMLLITNCESPKDVVASSNFGMSKGFGDADAEDGDFESEGVADVDDDSESNNYSPGSSGMSGDEEDLAEELRDLVEDNADFEREQELTTNTPNTQSLNRHDHAKISALQSAFPLAPTDICRKVLASSGGDLGATYGSLSDAFPPKLSESALLAWRDRGRNSTSKSKASQDTAPAKFTSTTRADWDICNKMRHDKDQSNDGGEERAFALMRQFDHRGLPPGSITSGKGLVQMAAISGLFTGRKESGESEGTSATLNGKASPEKEVDDDDGTSSSDISSTSEDETSDESSEAENGSDSGDAASDSDDSDNVDEDDSEDESPVGTQSHASNHSDSEHNDDIGESRDGSPGETSTRSLPISSRKPGQKRGQDYDDTSSSDASSSENSADDESSGICSSSESEDECTKDPPSCCALPVKPPIAQKQRIRSAPQTQQTQGPPTKAPQVEPAPPGAGKQSTKKRNARRRAAKRSKKLAQQIEVTNAPSTSTDAQSSTPPISDEKALFETRRKKLLDEIANGELEVDLSSQLVKTDNLPGTPTTTKRKRVEPNEFAQPDTQGRTPETLTSEEARSSASAQKRRRVDVGAGRRLLFGALGLRYPKTKEDENELRTKLMKDARLGSPGRKPGGSRAGQVNITDEEPVGNDLAAWKERILYRAVECCYEGVELSQPPFPFIQRWDPQQQGSWFQKKNKRGGQSKRAQRNQAHFYQDSHAGKKLKHEESTTWNEEGYDDTFNGLDDTVNNADIELNYDDDNGDESRQQEIIERTNDVSQFTDIDDLPSLPSDLSTLPTLHPGEVQLGMVITWQQWSCSSATNWQPQLSNVTGVVVRIDDDATGLEVCLAKRDRYLDRNEKRYDQNTGQRIYDRFEAPDLDDEDESEDEGYRTIGFAEMQQPRILQQPIAVTAGEEPDGHINHHCEVSPAVNITQEVEMKQLELIENADPLGTEHAAIVRDDVDIEANSVRPSSPPALTEESGKKTTTDSSAGSEAYQPGQGQQFSDMSVSDLSQISSPSRQLHESTSQAVSAMSQDRFIQGASSSKDVELDTISEKSTSNIPSSGFPSAGQSSAPLFDDNEDEVVAGTPKVVKSKVNVRSSVSSTRSGRQPDYTLDMDSAESDSFKIIDGDTSAVLDAEEQYDGGSDEDVSTPAPKPARAGMESTSSPMNPSTPGSLSSLNTVWCTALTSHNTQSPSKFLPPSTKMSQSSQALKDLEYNEAMLKLDDFPDDQESSSRITDSFKPNTLDGTVEEDDTVIKTSSISPQRMRAVSKISPPPRRKRRSPTRSSQFTLPPGTQVVELSSDSEPGYTENYADDEVDGTYSPEPDSLPRGSGWVHKKIGVGLSNSRSSTAPTGSQPKRKRRYFSSSQGLPSSTSISDFSQVKPRRKTSSKF
ncbi:hypothetical protein AAE478_006362 [Parahypoxylon ruwenzoriense]